LLHRALDALPNLPWRRAERLVDRDRGFRLTLCIAKQNGKLWILLRKLFQLPSLGFIEGAGRIPGREQMRFRAARPYFP
jgi:hypothetical protein